MHNVLALWVRFHASMVDDFRYRLRRLHGDGDDQLRSNIERDAIALGLEEIRTRLADAGNPGRMLEQLPHPEPLILPDEETVRAAERVQQR